MQLLHDSLYDRRQNDFYATRDMRCVPALLTVLRNLNVEVTGTIADLCCGEGHILQHFDKEHSVYASDIVDRGYNNQNNIGNLLDIEAIHPAVRLHISNLPYERGLVNKLTQKLIELCAANKTTLCLLFRHQFAAGFDVSRQVLFDTPHFVGEFKLPFRPYFELPLFIWGKDVTPSPQHPYAWYIWNFDKEWHGVTRFTERPENIQIFSDEDISRGETLDKARQDLTVKLLRDYGAEYFEAFTTLRQGSNIHLECDEWFFCEHGTVVPNDLVGLLQSNIGKDRNRHLGSLKPLDDGLPLLNTSQTYRWIV